MFQITTSSEQGKSVQKRVEEEYKMDKSHGLIVVLFLPLQWTYRNMQKESVLKMTSPPVKSLCVENTNEPDEPGWNNIVQSVYKTYDNHYAEKVESYENNVFF